jgi:CheY-like chemotaxis protein
MIKTVLVVEDEPLVRMLTSTLLRDQGFSVLEAINGGEALQLLKNGRAVDLVLTDIRMPVMDGLELSQHVRASFPALPVVFVTGEAGSLSAQLHGERWLSKPLVAEDLVASINAAIGAMT